MNFAAGNGAPDFLVVDFDYFSLITKGGIAAKNLVDLTPLVGSQRSQSVRWEPYTVEGKIYGVETALILSGLWT